jgi:hypothetical protein
MEDPLLAKYATNVLDSFIKIGDMQMKLKKKSDDQFLDDMNVAGYFHSELYNPNSGLPYLFKQ